MAVVNGCNIPEDLLYDVDPEANAFTWAKDNGGCSKNTTLLAHKSFKVKI